MRKVFFEKCEFYDESQLMEILERTIDKFSSIKKLPKESRILLKANLIIRKKPEAAATTNPLLLRSLAKVLLSRGFQVVIGDSPGGLFNKTYLKSIYDVCGLTDALKDLDVELNYNVDTMVINNSKGKKLKEFVITKYIKDVAYIINVPKLKTHVPMCFSGAIKNMFGTIAGEKKLDYHFVLSDNDDFADALVDLYLLNTPDLTIMDAIVGMDHNGPTAGKPIDINLIMASEDGFALDLAALNIIGIDPATVPIMRAAFHRGLISEDIDALEIVADESLHAVAVKNFVAPYIVPYDKNAQNSNSKLFTKLIESFKPKIAFNYNQCKICKECLKFCPANAIEIQKGKPLVDNGKCIKCYCCHELCTFNAIKIKQSKVLKTILTLALYNSWLQNAVENMFGKLGASAQEEN